MANGLTGRIFKHITTDRDNVTFDTGRFVVVVLAGLVIFTVLLLSGIAISVVWWNEKKFDFQGFGVGVASIFGGFATLLGAFAAYVAMDTRKQAGQEVAMITPPPVTYPAPVQGGGYGGGGYGGLGGGQQPAVTVNNQIQTGDDDQGAQVPINVQPAPQVGPTGPKQVVVIPKRP